MQVARLGRTGRKVSRLVGKRNNFIVATKCFAAMGPNPWDRGTSRRYSLVFRQWERDLFPRPVSCRAIGSRCLH
jgi:hypothetical protein